tara:strand:- start:5078 stop:5293 length:216 start_codon:yes stop_codon:yes gene_type:complete
MTAKAIETAVRTCKTKVHIVPRPVPSALLIRGYLLEWLVLSPHGNTDFHARSEETQYTGWARSQRWTVFDA